MGTDSTNLLLTQIRDALVEGNPVPTEAARWLLAGIAAHVAGSRLDQALGLSAPGRVSTASMVRMARRDLALREAATLAGGVESLARALVRFESGRWRHWRDRSNPPEGASELDRLLHRALKQGRCPTSPKQLRRIVAGT